MNNTVLYSIFHSDSKYVMCLGLSLTNHEICVFNYLPRQQALCLDRDILLNTGAAIRHQVCVLSYNNNNNNNDKKIKT